MAAIPHVKCDVGSGRENCFSKICKAKIEFFTNIQMTRNAEKKNKQILWYNSSETTQQKKKL